MKRLLAALTTLFMLAMPATALAYNPLSGACQAGTNSSSACTADGSTDPISGPNGAIKKASVIIATIAGVATVIIIMVAGFQYITSEGDPQKASTARSAIIGGAVGLVIIVAAEGILTFVLSKL